MARFIALDKTAHRTQGWAQATSYGFSHQTTLAPLLLEEVPHALPTLPMVFTRQGEDGPFQLMVLLSLEAGLNLMTTPDGRWLGGYVPAAFRSYPFRLLQDATSKQLTVCFDEESGLLRAQPAAEERRFFNDQGEPSAELARVLSFLEKCEQGRQVTQLAVNALAKHELIQPWELKVDRGNGEPQVIQGLYRVDEAALAELNGRALSDLKKRNALMLAYGQLLSQHRVANFAKLYQLRAKLAKTVAPVAGPDVDSLFGGNGDTLNLEFLNQ